MALVCAAPPGCSFDGKMFVIKDQELPFVYYRPTRDHQLALDENERNQQLALHQKEAEHQLAIHQKDTDLQLALQQLAERATTDELMA